jgi:ribokinase
MGRVFVVGSINQDVVAEVDRLPGPGETVVGRRLRHFQGGKGANQAVAARRMGAETRFIGRVGRDEAGSALRAALEREGIETAISLDDDRPTGTALISVDRAGENSIVVIGGANATLAPEHCAALEDAGSGDVLLLQNEISAETNRRCAAMARSRGVRVVLNAAPAAVLGAEDRHALDMLVVNQHELAIALGADATAALCAAVSADDVLERLGTGVVTCARDVGIDLVLTLGARGAVAAIEGRGMASAAPRVEAVDTTGAGDCFTGALAAFLAAGRPADAALREARKAASLSVTQPGAAASFPTLGALSRQA